VVAAAEKKSSPSAKLAEPMQASQVAAAEAKPVVQPPAPAASSPKVRAQLGSMRSLEGATRKMTRLSRVFANELSTTELTVSRIDQGERGVFYRILTSPFPNRAAAGDLCHKLESNNAGCVLVQPRPNDA
jgi:hypothetical protein